MTQTRKVSRKDLEQDVTDRIVAALENGTVPWQKPWNASGILPTSVATGRPYRGINVWLLSMSAQAQGFASPYWLTFKQATDHSGHVSKGSKGTSIIFWKRLSVKDEAARAAGDADAMRSVFLLRGYTVFNLEQCEDVKLPPRFDLPEPEQAVTVSDTLQDILDGYADGPTVKHVLGDAAYYTPLTDVVTVPALEQYETEGHYAQAVLHELTHSTGHASRLDRFGKNGEPSHFGSERYAREELVAQMGASMLAAVAGLDPFTDTSAAYIKGWLQALSDDKSLVVTAAQQAQRASDRILGTEQVERAEVAA